MAQNLESTTNQIIRRIRGYMTRRLIRESLEIVFQT